MYIYFVVQYIDFPVVLCYCLRGDFMFEKYLTTNEILFKHALGCRDVFGKEFHIFNELFLLIGDSAKFTSDRLIEEIHSNSLVIIPKHHFHQFDHIGEEKNYHRYVLQFNLIDGLDKIIAEIFDCVKLIQNVSPQTITLFRRLDVLIEENKSDEDKEILLKAIFTEILMDLKYNYSDTAITEHITDATTQKIIDYINANYLQNITIKSISESLNFSETYISHKFKEIMHISIYKYILQKKLVHAHRLISTGTPATDAASLCGFNEYSGFYKIYKKHFGCSPSKTHTAIE